MSDGNVPVKKGSVLRKVAPDRHQQKKRRTNAGESQPRRNKKSGIPSETECLRLMARLAGLVAIGFLRPPQANAIRAAYQQILQFHRNKAKEVEKGLANADVLELLRSDPNLLSLLEPLLTDEQVAMVTTDMQGHNDE